MTAPHLILVVVKHPESEPRQCLVADAPESRSVLKVSTDYHDLCFMLGIDIWGEGAVYEPEFGGLLFNVDSMPPPFHIIDVVQLSYSR